MRFLMKLVKAMSSSHSTFLRPLPRLIVALLIAASASGCLFKKEDPDAGLSGAQQFYDRANKAMQSGDYENSIKYAGARGEVIALATEESDVSALLVVTGLQHQLLAVTTEARLRLH